MPSFTKNSECFPTLGSTDLTVTRMVIYAAYKHGARLETSSLMRSILASVISSCVLCKSDQLRLSTLLNLSNSLCSTQSVCTVTPQDKHHVIRGIVHDRDGSVYLAAVVLIY